ncbi:MAG: Dual specificity phosphatase, catalytic domain [Gemmataceae bacterium]|nr:Dual specificity phosphatase, catalytic domain [Gemmataceae bacterium]
MAEALKLLDPTRQRPNRLVVSLGDAILDTLDVLGPFDEWRRQHAHIRLSDYYDESNGPADHAIDV